ncbi:uncharacterized protein ARB_00667 [Trichophyton benhamiae CBS 112371]|uniref:Aminoglycoside phosphotransferase domain-containing protein n=1 Tax=Arthroderma benhamiae (strain ATCC MYA-4681 / CBS 112371) TaxID=663331 RepID=D4AWV1_ARTBC|nr:uncharacterized protein ARB_00667 [Trichophyton benhamiae CBS 112371]EFE32482.1 hypothetical protein ARB_00667 [Trichophyton benhamiae CBS 112371]
MAIPRHVARSASQLFLLDKESPQYKAYLVIADIPHPDRAILGAFIKNASDSEKAAQFFLNKISMGDGSSLPSNKAVYQFLSNWKILINMFRPVEATSLSDEEKKLVFERDGGRCCLTGITFENHRAEGLVYLHIVPPTVFTSGPDLSEGSILFEPLSYFLSRELLDIIYSLENGQTDKLGNVWLLSTTAWDYFRKGDAYLRVQRGDNKTESNLKQEYSVFHSGFTPSHPESFSLDRGGSIHIENRKPHLTLTPNKNLFAIHRSFSRPLAWMEAHEYMQKRLANASMKSSISPFFSIFRRLWTSLPSFVRTSVYDFLAQIGLKMYPPTLSMTVYKLPFGLYLRRGSPSLAPKYHVEAHTLKMIEQSTHIPAPRAIDVAQTSRYSYLLMTCVPGRPIGPSLNTMTDEEIEQVVVDLKGYISELRKIPRDPSSEYLICNSQGGGFLDWRIPDSQNKELRFKSEADFNKYLTDPFWEEIRTRATKSHDIPHKVVFTHGDLNPRNILAENGKITGIVDWENAGWFPEYWEYTKMHYTVRSVERWLVDVVDSVFPGYREELWVENMLSDLLGPF